MSDEQTERAKHMLKTHPDAFQAIWEGRKTAEFRKDDRGYEVGDFLGLMEYDPNTGRITDREIVAEVTDIRREGKYGIPEGYAMLSLRRIAGTDFGGLAWEISA